MEQEIARQINITDKEFLDLQQQFRIVAKSSAKPASLVYWCYSYVMLAIKLPCCYSNLMYLMVFTYALKGCALSRWICYLRMSLLLQRHCSQTSTY